MQATRRLLQQRKPMIKFVGGRHAAPQKPDHAPHVHPASPSESLPKSFAQYREEAIQHGPLKGSTPQPAPSSTNTSMASRPTQAPPQRSVDTPYGAVGGKSAKQLGPISPGKGEFMDRNELPQRFHRTAWSQAEIDAIESGGASMFA